MPRARSGWRWARATDPRGSTASPGSPRGRSTASELGIGQSLSLTLFYSRGRLSLFNPILPSRSVNKAGKSEPSEPTPLATAKPRKCKFSCKQLYLILRNILLGI